MANPKRDSPNEKIYHTIYRGLKKLLTFKIQKAVRKIKQGNKEMNSEAMDQQNEKKQEIVEREREKALKQKERLDSIQKEGLKLLTLYMMTSIYEISLDHDREYFEKELPEFEQKLSGFMEEPDSTVDTLKWFLSTISGHKQYKELDELLVFKISRNAKVKEKADRKKQAKREKEKVKRQLEKAKKNAALEEIGAITENANEKSEEPDEEIPKPPKSDRPHFKERRNPKQSHFKNGNSKENPKFRERSQSYGGDRFNNSQKYHKKEFRHDDADSMPRKKFHHNDDGRPQFRDRKDNQENQRFSRSNNRENGRPNEYQKQGRSRDFGGNKFDNSKRERTFDKNRSFEKDGYHRKNEDRNSRFNGDRSNSRNNSRFDNEELHPSWKFKKEEKNAVFIAPFQGTKIKLTE